MRVLMGPYWCQTEKKWLKFDFENSKLIVRSAIQSEQNPQFTGPWLEETGSGSWTVLDESEKEISFLVKGNILYRTPWKINSRTGSLQIDEIHADKTVAYNINPTKKNPFANYKSPYSLCFLIPFNPEKLQEKIKDIKWEELLTEVEIAQDEIFIQGYCLDIFLNVLIPYIAPYSPVSEASFKRLKSLEEGKDLNFSSYVYSTYKPNEEHYAFAEGTDLPDELIFKEQKLSLMVNLAKKMVGRLAELISPQIIDNILEPQSIFDEKGQVIDEIKRKMVEKKLDELEIYISTLEDSEIKELSAHLLVSFKKDMKIYYEKREDELLQGFIAIWSSEVNSHKDVLMKDLETWEYIKNFFKEIANFFIGLVSSNPASFWKIKESKSLEAFKTLVTDEQLTDGVKEEEAAPANSILKNKP